MAQLKFILRRDKGRIDDSNPANGIHPVWLRITHERKSSYVATGVKIKASEWNEKTQRVNRSNTAHRIYNGELERLMLQAQHVVFDLKGKGMLDANNVQRHLKGGDSNGDFFDYMISHIKRVETKKQVWNYKNFKTAMAKFADFSTEIKKRQTLKFREITPKLLRDFEDYLRDPEGMYKNNDTTIAKNMSMLRAVFNSAISDGIIKVEESPFGKGKYTMSRPPTTRTKLSYEEIKIIEKLDLPKNTNIWNVRNIFIFAFYADGMRFGDIATLKWNRIQGDRLIYSMAKTGKLQSTHLPKQALKILEHYKPAEPEKFVFPILDNDRDYSNVFYLKQRISAGNALTNKYLKKIKELAGITEEISFHVARHSYAHHLVTKRVPTYVVSKKLQHSNLAITNNYLKPWDSEFIDESMEGVFD
jgi:integrase/recombinase XerD